MTLKYSKLFIHSIQLIAKYDKKDTTRNHPILPYRLQDHPWKTCRHLHTLHESSDMHTSFSYQPTMGKLDRLHLRTRLHSQQKGSSNYGTIYWPKNYSLTLEIITLENAFDDYSTMETRISERSDVGFFGIAS